MKRKHKRLICWLFAAGGILWATAWCSSAAAALAECIDATCRISTADGSRGTGCAFENSQGYVFVLTAAHVVGSQRAVQCEFWRDGHQSVPLAAEVITRNQPADAAVVCLPVSSLGGVLPACVPLARRGYTLSPGQTVTSVGCANGAWATGWKGHVIGYSGGSLCFTPAPADGRSGSALFDAGGEQIVGLIFGRSDGQQRGYAVTVENLYRALNIQQTAAGWVHSPLPLLCAGQIPALGAGIAENAQCGPNGCTPRGYILPYRNQQQQLDYQRDRQLDELDRRLQPQNQVWPTLPAEPPGLQPRVDQPGEAATHDEAGESQAQLTARPSGLGVALTLAAALGVGVLLFYVVGKQ